MRVVIDTNLFISSLLGKYTSEILNDITQKRYDLILSDKQLDEIIGVLKRPKFKKIIPYEKIEKLEILLKKVSFFVDVEGNISDCRDPKDNFLLEMGINARADFIITGDEDLLVLNPYKNIKIIKYSEFKEILPLIE
ncbi:MAG: putative toxin-antitoxin system toxin component, PIN family [Leptospiraceae bacterium]|nr:putative toxin-antitoxin system toxin component, PIN family [Leptospiraceae bacterium]